MRKIYNSEWNFKNNKMNELVHGIHPYPAMLMPLIPRKILKSFKTKPTTFLDPYMGSGTTIVEAQRIGVKKIFGFDLNPLAVEITKCKITQFKINSLKNDILKFKEYKIEKIKCNNFYFDTIFTWFKEDTISQLSKLNFYINNYVLPENFIFFKIAFSETIRCSSMTRKNEFKLYRIPIEKRNAFNPDVTSIFLNIIDRNFKYFLEYEYPKNKCEISTIYDSILNVDNYIEDNYIDLVITSPPYGDSKTTVSYGQFSRLANEWFNEQKPNDLDNKLLGGITRNINKNYIFGIKELDKAIFKIKKVEANFSKKRITDVISFFIDYEESIKKISRKIKVGGSVVYIVGNRRVRNIELPTDVITYKMFEKYGFKHTKTIIRDILNKRMPSKASNKNNKVGVIPTMSKEYIVFMNKVTNE